MAATTPSREPGTLRAGDTLSFLISEPDYPASDGWALSYVLINSAGKITYSTSASGDDHAATVAAATTATWAAGTYTWTAAAVLGSQRYTLRQGQIDILPDPTSVAAYDTRSHARRTLDAIEAWIEGHDPAVASYRIGDRQMQYIPIGELLTLRSRYQREVRGQEAAAACRLPSRIRVRL